MRPGAKLTATFHPHFRRRHTLCVHTIADTIAAARPEPKSLNQPDIDEPIQRNHDGAPGIHPDQ
jgi:hypothetical protein